MFERLTTILNIDSEAIFSILAASGGIARIVTGTSHDPKVSWIGEAGRVVFIAMPIGIIAGSWAEHTYSSEVLPYAAAFTAGVVSLNVVRFLLSAEGFKFLRTLFGGKDGK